MVCRYFFSPSKLRYKRTPSFPFSTVYFTISYSPNELTKSHLRQGGVSVGGVKYPEFRVITMVSMRLLEREWGRSSSEGGPSFEATPSSLFTINTGIQTSGDPLSYSPWKILEGRFVRTEYCIPELRVCHPSHGYSLSENFTGLGETIHRRL